MKLKLSVLDQSSISVGMSPEEALANTVRLAKHTERLGYSRFWVSEHHDSFTLAGTSPEVLIAHLAAKTERIRVGSGGVMLPHYSAFKVAENFRVLEGLTPNRIDLGLGRAPGGMPRATIALNGGRDRGVDRYPQQIDELLEYLHDSLKEDHPLYGLKAAPVVQSAPEVWILGSSPSSAMLAAEKGLPYTFALFINGEGGEQYTRFYRNQFKPSLYLKKPLNMVTVFAICAETDQEAERLAASMDLSMIMMEQGMESKGIPSPEEAASYSYSPYELERVQENRKRMVIGSPKTVLAKLVEIAEKYETDEIMLASILYDFNEKLTSYELIAKAAGIH